MDSRPDAKPFALRLTVPRFAAPASGAAAAGASTVIPTASDLGDASPSTEGRRIANDLVLLLLLLLLRLVIAPVNFSSPLVKVVLVEAAP